MRDHFCAPYLLFVGLLELFYREAHVIMKSLSTSFTWLSVSLGWVQSLSMSLMISPKGSLLPNNLNFFYWLLAILSCLNFLNFFYKYTCEDNNSKLNRKGVAVVGDKKNGRKESSQYWGVIFIWWNRWWQRERSEE